MQVTDFDYQLPAELIAQHPAERRDASRMMVLHRWSGRCELRAFPDIEAYLRPNDCLVLNNTKVIAARLLGRRVPSGGQVEAFVIEQSAPGLWQCLLRPGRRLKAGARVTLDGTADEGFVVVGKRDDGTFEVRFDDVDVLRLLDRVGHVPLPPYIDRQATSDDKQRYQTVYASKAGAVAAPTAGLHFTPERLTALAARGVRLAEVTLHVGPGTFKPVKVEHIGDHEMHEESYELSERAADEINAARASGGRIIAVGTTSVRTLESCVAADGQSVHAARGRTRIFLHPPKTPRVVDGMLTNFHLPRSTLLMLVSCFCGLHHVMAAYRLAVQERFRFYSYGDCMLLLPSS